jgi:site-specific DNA-methyltransferase (adenine-specific)
MLEVNRIYNADCLELMKQLPDKCVDLVLTDVPYNIGMDGGKGWDKIDNYEEWIKNIFSILKRISKRQIIFFDYSYTKLFEELEIPKERFIWHREGGFSGEFIKKGYEPFYLYGGDVINIPKIKNNYADKDDRLKPYKSVSNVWDIPNLVGKKLEKEPHPTQKPLELFTRCIYMASNEGDLILDCFSGSGTTAIACHNLNRNFICIECDIDYFNASVERLNNVKAQLKLF